MFAVFKTGHMEHAMEAAYFITVLTSMDDWLSKIDQLQLKHGTNDVNHREVLEGDGDTDIVSALEEMGVDSYEFYFSGEPIKAVVYKEEDTIEEVWMIVPVE